MHHHLLFHCLDFLEQKIWTLFPTAYLQPLLCPHLDSVNACWSHHRMLVEADSASMVSDGLTEELQYEDHLWSAHWVEAVQATLPSLLVHCGQLPAWQTRLWGGPVHSEQGPCDWRNDWEPCSDQPCNGISASLSPSIIQFQQLPSRASQYSSNTALCWLLERISATALSCFNGPEHYPTSLPA